jgi:hypothetical protein
VPDLRGEIARREAGGARGSKYVPSPTAGATSAGLFLVQGDIACNWSAVVGWLDREGVHLARASKLDASDEGSQRLLDDDIYYWIVFFGVTMLPLVTVRMLLVA